MGVLRALSRGIGCVVTAPAILVGVYAATLAMVLPLGLALRGMLAGHLGGSLEAESALSGANWGWWQEFFAQATGVGRTFTPSILGSAAVLENVSGLLDRQGPPPALVGILSAYLLVWIFLGGGIIDRYARNRPTRVFGFFGACGTFFFRFLRLAVVAGLGYWLLFRFVHDWLFDNLYGWATRDLTVERTDFATRLALYVLFGAILALYNMVIDYARIRAVVEDRRSMLGALVASVRFVRRRPVSTIGLYAANGCVLLVIVAMYAMLAPDAGGGRSLSVWIAFLGMQVYILARLASKLLFYASQTAFFQADLVHVGHVAAEPPPWPEPPAAEAMAVAPDEPDEPNEPSGQGLQGPTRW